MHVEHLCKKAIKLYRAPPPPICLGRSTWSTWSVSTPQVKDTTARHLPAERKAGHGVECAEVPRLSMCCACVPPPLGSPWRTSKATFSFLAGLLQDAPISAPMASHRIGARLSGLSPEQLVAFIDEQAPLWSAAAMRVAEEHAARLVEQPEWVLSEVLLSPDLAPHILAQLPTTEHAVKGTCRAWRRGWKETLKKRERPRLVVVGGESSDGEILHSLERYDPSTNEWEEAAMAPMPTSRANVGTALLDGKLYAAGGQNDEADYATSNSVERYELAANAWEAVAPMAAAREGHVMAVLDGKLYAVGGCNYDGGGAFSSVERYDPRTNAWEAVAPMATARVNPAAAVLDGKLYAVGGLNDDDGILSSVERYDSAANAWEAVAPMATARYALGVAVLDGKLYAAGGEKVEEDEDMPVNTVERFDPVTNGWEAVAPMVTARSLHLADDGDGV